MFYLTYCVDPAAVSAIPADPDASNCYAQTVNEYYNGYAIVSTGKVAIGAEVTESKQAPEDTATRFTLTALAVKKPIRLVGDSDFVTFC